MAYYQTGCANYAVCPAADLQTVGLLLRLFCVVRNAAGGFERNGLSHPDVEEAPFQPGNGHGDIGDSAQGNLCIQVLAEGLFQLALHQLGAMHQILIARHHLHHHRWPPITLQQLPLTLLTCVTECIIQFTTRCIWLLILEVAGQLPRKTPRQVHFRVHCYPDGHQAIMKGQTTKTLIGSFLASRDKRSALPQYQLDWQRCHWCMKCCHAVTVELQSGVLNCVIVCCQQCSWTAACCFSWMVLTHELQPTCFWVMMTATPSVSNCGLPARPIICKQVLRSYSWYPAVSPLSLLHLLVPFRTTRCAGRFTPIAKVDVVQSTCSTL